jgi:RNA polymerase sigma-70 factor (ECF subfamily)
LSQTTATTPGDQALLGRIAAQDRTAFAVLYERYAPRLLGMLLRMLRKRSEAEDCLQEVFWQVWARASRYDPERSSPLVWLVMIARSRARDSLRRRRRDMLQLAPDQGEPAGADRGREAAGPPDWLEQSEDARMAHSALHQLPAEQRHAIQMSFFENLTHEQIAATQSIPLGTVKTRIRRGMIRLRELVETESKAVRS